MSVPVRIFQVEFYDKNGEMVATYSNNGWTMYTTNAEAARQTEMCMICLLYTSTLQIL